MFSKNFENILVQNLKIFNGAYQYEYVTMSTPDHTKIIYNNTPCLEETYPRLRNI